MSVHQASSGPQLLALLVAVLVCGAWGQGRNACPSLTSTECYYNGTGAAMVPLSVQNPNKYFIVGGFFDVHKKGVNAYECSSEISMEGILSVQAFLWGIRYYAPVLAGTGVSVGAVAFDSCMRPEQNIENMLSYAQCKMYLQSLPETSLVAYVGPYSNEAVQALAPLASDLSLPLLAPLANSPELTYDENKFLLKLSPAFGYVVDGIYSLLQKLQVDKVILLYDPEDPLMVSAYNHLSRAINNNASKCTHYEAAYVMSEKPNIIQKLDDSKDIRYLVPLMSKELIGDLMDAIEARSSIPANAFRYILAGVGRDKPFLMSKSATANNSLIVEASYDAGVVNSNLAKEVNDFITGLSNSVDGQVGPVPVSWITQYYSRYGKPVINDETPSNTRFMLAKTLAAVKGIIEGMNTAVRGCGNQVCDDYRNVANKGQNLLRLFSSELYGNSNTNGAVPMGDIKIDVYQYYATQISQNVVNTRFDLAAEIQMQNLRMVTTLAKELLDGTHFIEPDCPGLGACCEDPTIPPAPVETTTPSGQPGAGASSSANMSNWVYVRYPEGQEITGAYFDVDRPDSEYGTRFDLNHRWIIALGVLAGLGILSVVVFEIYILYKLLGTRLGNKWRTMWLGQLLLFGVLLCYLTLFAYLPIPTTATCGITRFGVGVSYSICFAVLLVKLMVILTSRASSDVLLPGDVESPNYLKGIYQFLMFIFAVGVQVVIDVQWLITVPPEAVPVISNNGDKVWVCNHYTWEAGKDMERMDGWVRSNFENHLMSLTYIMVMILITTILSLNAHGIITNHRESVFIGIAAGFSIPVWLAWGLVGGLNQDHDYAQEFGDACIAFGLFCTATLILFSMFLPKVRQLVNMGVEGIYLEDDRDTYYAGSVIMAPPSYKSKGQGSVVYVNNQGIYSEPVVIGNGDPSKDPVANRLRHPGSTYSAPPVFAKKADSTYGGNARVLRMTGDLRGNLPHKPKSEVGTQSRGSSRHGTLTRSRSQSSLGAL